MSERREMERAVRQPILSFLQKPYDESEAVVIGIALVLEVLDGDGMRSVHKITSDAGGHPLAWHTVEGFVAAMQDLDEIDDMLEDEDE